MTIAQESEKILKTYSPAKKEAIVIEMILFHSGNPA